MVFNPRVDFSVDIVHIVREVAIIENRGAFRSAVVNYISVFARLFKNGDFVHCSVEGADMCLRLKGYHFLYSSRYFSYCVSAFSICMTSGMSCSFVFPIQASMSRLVFAPNSLRKA